MTKDSAAPTVDRFRALARSSPWLWTTVEFERTIRTDVEPEHVWIRRPDQLRVTSLAGELKADRPITIAQPGARRRWPTEVRPVVDDGLVLERPTDFDIDYDEPFYSDYHWIAMLDPVELADCHDPDVVRPVELTDLAVVSHHGRTTWQAMAHPTSDYDPRCACCALLDGEFDYDDQQWIPGYPALVRLDVETGLCVFVDNQGGSRSGIDLDVRIIAAESSTQAGPPSAPISRPAAES